MEVELLCSSLAHREFPSQMKATCLGSFVFFFVVVVVDDSLVVVSVGLFPLFLVD